MKYLFLILFSSVAFCSSPKFHFGDHVIYYKDKFYRNCKGYIDDWLVDTSGNIVYKINTYQCNDESYDKIGWMEESKLKHTSGY